MDLIIRNANLPDGRIGIDIGIKDGKIAALEVALTAKAQEEIDASGYLVSPPFVDPHFHMDSTLSLGQPRMNISGTLLEGIALWGELKPKQSVDDIIKRAMHYCDLAVAMGIGAIRSHVDVCDDELKSVTAMLEVRRLVAPYLDLQLVAFPQDGYLRDHRGGKLMETALDRELMLLVVFHILNEQCMMVQNLWKFCADCSRARFAVDMHCDESDDPHSVISKH